MAAPTGLDAHCTGYIPSRDLSTVHIEYAGRAPGVISVINSHLSGMFPYLGGHLLISQHQPSMQIKVRPSWQCHKQQEKQRCCPKVCQLLTCYLRGCSERERHSVAREARLEFPCRSWCLTSCARFLMCFDINLTSFLL